MHDAMPAEPEPCLRLDDQLCFALYAATASIVRAYRPLLAELGLTYPQYLLMMALWEKEEVSVSDLSARLGLPLNGVTPVLDRLERAELLERRRRREDRRVVVVTLTGRRTGPRGAGRPCAAQRPLPTTLAPGALASLREELQDLTRVMGQDTL